MFSQKNGTVYVGVTANLSRRVWQHKNKIIEGFTKKYNVDKLGWYEMHGSITSAIAREKYIKGKVRKYKLNLIEKMNPNWDDLYDALPYRYYAEPDLSRCEGDRELAEPGSFAAAQDDDG